MPWAFVSALSLNVLISYGTIFYALALFVDPMGRELGWGKSEMMASYSLALGTSAFCAVPVGRLIDLGYGRMVMTGGSLLAGVLLLLWSWVGSYPAFVLIWVLSGPLSQTLFYWISSWTTQIGWGAIPEIDSRSLQMRVFVLGAVVVLALRYAPRGLIPEVVRRER